MSWRSFLVAEAADEERPAHAGSGIANFLVEMRAGVIGPGLPGPPHENALSEATSVAVRFGWPGVVTPLGPHASGRVPAPSPSQMNAPAVRLSKTLGQPCNAILIVASRACILTRANILTKGRASALPRLYQPFQRLRDQWLPKKVLASSTFDGGEPRHGCWRNDSWVGERRFAGAAKLSAESHKRLWSAARAAPPFSISGTSRAAPSTRCTCKSLATSSGPGRWCAPGSRAPSSRSAPRPAGGPFWLHERDGQIESQTD